MKLFKQTEKSIDPEISLRNFRFLGEEAESLGLRLDAARSSLAQSKTEWSRWYWTETLDRLLTQWRALPVLHDAEAKMSITPRWVIDYEFYERDYGTGYDVTDRIFDYFRSDPNLDRSWEMVRAERLSKCQC
jgi:hypothetical protein